MYKVGNVMLCEVEILITINIFDYEIQKIRSHLVIFHTY